MSRHYHDVATSSVDVVTLPQCHYRCHTLINAMLRHTHVDVATLEAMLRHWGTFWSRCRDIEKAFSSFKIFFLFSSSYSFLHIQFILMNINLSRMKYLN